VRHLPSGNKFASLDVPAISQKCSLIPLKETMLTNLKQPDLEAVIAACEQAAASGPVDPETGGLPLIARDRVYTLVDTLPREAQDELLALMWTGGPKNENSFEQNLELAQKTATDNHAAFLSEQAARLPDYLKEGLKKMGAS
jgi:hypothetical protein